jgi:urease accessory protein
VLLAALLPEHAHAHPVIEGVGGFYGGLLHPLMVPAHLMCLVALGLLVGQQPEAQRRGLLARLGAALIAGLVTVVAAFAPTHQDLALLVVTALVGILVALAQPLSVLVTAPLMLAGGMTIELDSVPQDISMLTAFMALAGTALAATTIALMVATLSGRMRGGWQGIAVRVVGAWIAAGAILVLALKLAR